jgi:hypothetical protein
VKKPFDNIEVIQLAHALTRKWLLGRQAAAKMAKLDLLVSQRTRELQSAATRPFIPPIGCATPSHL